MSTTIYFKFAPVVERVLGVQFQPIATLHTGLLGTFWQSLGPAWSNATDAPPIPAQSERFERSAAFNLSSIPLVFSAGPVGGRLQLLNSTGDRMIQLQNGRFHFNWKGEAGDNYPRYPRIRAEFEAFWHRFRDFLRSETKTELMINQWEVTYVNHFPKGRGWQVPSDWHRLFRSFARLPSEGTELNLESAGGTWQYEILPQRGRLYVELRHGRREFPTIEELLMLNLTARGPTKADNDPDAELSAGLDLGHDAIVTTFKYFTSDTAHTEWEFQNGTAGT
jgi:uncharacterized protein (TIGR04255 family)